MSSYWLEEYGTIDREKWQMAEGRSIYKYQLRADGGAQVLYMPHGALVKKVGFQNGYICIWAIVNTAQTAVTRHVYEVFGTGHPIPKEPTYVETVFEEGFVWHLFEWKDSQA